MCMRNIREGRNEKKENYPDAVSSRILRVMCTRNTWNGQNKKMCNMCARKLGTGEIKKKACSVIVTNHSCNVFARNQG